ncbi:MAG: hypothetical protein QW597_05335 [Thermoplasmataceae archaeon]
MVKSGPTAKQIEYIERLINEDTARNDVIVAYLNTQKASDIKDLSVKSASELIDRLRGMNPKNNTVAVNVTRPASPKQISYIESLQRSEESRSYVSDFLQRARKKSLAEIDSSEASDLIDYLKPLSGTEKRDYGDVPATEKQLKFIRHLQKSSPAKNEVESALKRLRKKSIEELAVNEASDLITALRVLK